MGKGEGEGDKGSKEYGKGYILGNVFKKGMSE